MQSHLVQDLQAIVKTGTEIKQKNWFSISAMEKANNLDLLRCLKSYRHDCTQHFKNTLIGHLNFFLKKTSWKYQNKATADTVDYLWGIITNMASLMG